MSYSYRLYPAKNRIAKMAHAWNIAKPDSTYLCVDATWDAEYINDSLSFVPKASEQYLMLAPQEFLSDHMPFDPLWQLVNNPINSNDFVTKNYEKLNKVGQFDYVDSIMEHTNLGSITTLKKSIYRISTCGITNNLVKNQISFYLNKIVNIKFNTAVEIFNTSLCVFNYYISLKNKQFNKTTLQQNEIQSLLTKSKNLNSTVRNSITNLEASDKELKRLITDLKLTSIDLEKKINIEQRFLDEYIDTPQELRLNLFLLSR